MERLLDIKKEIQEKKGKEWIGLQTQTEQQLKSLMWYLDHPRVHEDKKLAEEIIELYYLAKASGFLKMEGIIRKLDQLGVKIAKDELAEKIGAKSTISGKSQRKIQFLNVGQSILELKQKIQDLITSSSGKSLPEPSIIAINKLLQFLDHPELPNKPQLFDDMLDRYNKAEEIGFAAMQSFNDMLNMAEIKLGKISTEMIKIKSSEEIKLELEQEKSAIAEEWEKIEDEKKKLTLEWNKIDEEKKELTLEWEKLEIAKKNFESEKNSNQ